MGRYTGKDVVPVGERSPGFNNTARWDSEGAAAYSAIVDQMAGMALGDPAIPGMVAEAYQYLDAEMPFIPLVQSAKLLLMNTTYWTGWPTNDKSDLSAPEVLGTWEHSTAKDKIRDLPICFGYGDGGGGPTEGLIQTAKGYAEMPGMPALNMGTVRGAFVAMEGQAEGLPDWHDEIYLEGHRGVLTSNGWIKRNNRKAEIALHEAEALAAMMGAHCTLAAA